MPNESFCMKTTTAIVLAALALGLMQTACTSRDKDSEAPIKKPAAQVHTYTMRGIVVALPTTDAETAAKRRPLRIHHEPVHPFHNREGKDVGMGEMTMEFPYLKKGVSLEGVKVGSKIEFTMRVDYSSDEHFLIESVKILPDDIALKLKNSTAKPGTPKPTDATPTPSAAPTEEPKPSAGS
ncbi:MAG: copper-binding protein [Phycisphaerales bacterium]